MVPAVGVLLTACSLAARQPPLQPFHSATCPLTHLSFPARPSTRSASASRAGSLGLPLDGPTAPAGPSPSASPARASSGTSQLEAAGTGRFLLHSVSRTAGSGGIYLPWLGAFALSGRHTPDSGVGKPSPAHLRLIAKGRRQPQFLAPVVFSSLRSFVEPTVSKSHTPRTPLPPTLQGPFLKFAERHRRLVNALVRNEPKLLLNSFRFLLKAHRLLDFDNKCAEGAGGVGGRECWRRVLLWDVRVVLGA